MHLGPLDLLGKLSSGTGMENGRKERWLEYNRWRRSCTEANWHLGPPAALPLAIRYVLPVLWMTSYSHIITRNFSVLFCSLAVLDPRVGHTMDVLSPFVSVLCHSDWLFHGESCPRLNIVYPGSAWSSSPACTWHYSLHYIFLRATPLIVSSWCDHSLL